MYIIGAYTQVYMDNCSFDASKTHRSIVIRGTPGETHNSLYISNSTVEDGTLKKGAIRIDNETMMLHVGIGNNITSASYKNGFTSHDGSGNVTPIEADYEEEGVVEYTGKLYRRYPADYICTGEDMEATIFEGFLMSNPSNCGSAVVECQLRKDFPLIPFHYYTHGAGLADLHTSGIIPGTTADSVTISAPSGTTFPVGTRLYITSVEH